LMQNKNGLQTYPCKISYPLVKPLGNASKH
jgi:hypothetical protein